MGRIDLAFIDGHHEKEPCLHYYQLIKGFCHENSIIVVDDIYWSASMKSAWETLISDNDVSLSLDMFDYGVLFYSPKIKERNQLNLIRNTLKPWQFLL